MKSLRNSFLIFCMFFSLNCFANDSVCIIESFSSAYCNFYYLKNDMKRSAQEMKQSIKKISKLVKSERVETYFKILLLFYRLDGGMLSLVRDEIVENGDIAQLKSFVGKLRSDIFHPVDESRFEEIQNFINSLD